MSNDDLYIKNTTCISIGIAEENVLVIMQVRPGLRVYVRLNCLTLVCLILMMCLRITYSQNHNGALMVTENSDDEKGASALQEEVLNYVEEITDFDPNMEAFEATSEWKEIKKGQSIPRGLHVRMNLQTGKKEAKLLDKEKETIRKLPDIKKNNLHSLNYLQNVMEEGENENSGENFKIWKKDGKEEIINLNNNYFSEKELKRALKKLKVSREDEKHPSDIKGRFRSMEELKKELEDINLNIKTDHEILNELILNLGKDSLTTEEHINILDELEEFVHQYDNGVLLADLGALRLLARDLNSTAEEVRSRAALVLGSAAQSNKHVQFQVLTTTIIQQLISKLLFDKSETVHVKALYSLSSILRHFPDAQLSFLRLGGLQAMQDLFVRSHIEKVKVKIVRMLNDLLEENHSELRKAQKEYSQLNLLEHVKAQHWCSEVPQLLHISQLEDYTLREVVLQFMVLLKKDCQFDHRIHRLLLDLEHQYRSAALDDEGLTKYIIELISTVKSIWTDHLEL